MATITKAYKIDEETDQKFYDYVKSRGSHMGTALEELMKKELQREQELIGTSSFHQDRLTSWIYANIDLQKVLDTGVIYLDIPKEEAGFFEGTGLQCQKRIRGAVISALRLWIQTHHKKLDKQGIVKDNIHNRTDPPEVEIALKVSGIPTKPLSDLTIDDVNHVIQFNCIVIGMESRKTLQKDSKHEFIAYLTIQEPEEESKNSNPILIPCIVHGSETQNLATGQRKRVLGFYKTIPAKNKDENSLIIDCLYMQDLAEFKELKLNQEQIDKAKLMCQQDEEKYIQSLIGSIAPHIDNRDLEKFALLLSIIGGSQLGNYRKESHLMFIGEPDTGKSELIKSAHRITQKSAVVDGSNATAKGLLYGLDEYDGHKVLRAGAMVLNNGGHVYIDEYDKMPKPEQKGMNISMEQQFAKYDKVGHNVKGETKTTVIACANPVNDRWNEHKNLRDNCPFDGSTLSRFDVIIRLRHSNSQANAEHQIKHILKHMKQPDQEVLTPDYLKGLINYIRKQFVCLSEEAEQRIVEFYTYFKSIEQDEGTLPIETRQIIGIIRLCTAYAKITFRDKVDIYTVNKIIEFYKSTLETLGMKTGSVAQLDLRGHSVNRDEYFEQVFLSLQNDKKQVTIQDLAHKLKENVNHFRTDEAIEAYVLTRTKSGWLYEPELGVLQKQ